MSLLACLCLVASWLVHMSEERAVHVGALAAGTLLFSWTRDLTPTMPLSTLEYKWVTANCWGKLNKLSHEGEVEILTS